MSEPEIKYLITRTQSVTVRSGFTQDELVALGVPVALFEGTLPVEPWQAEGLSVTKRLEGYLTDEDLADVAERFEIDGDVDNYAFEVTAPGRTYDHDPKPDSQPEAGDRCNECGEDITWIGPGTYDYMHVDDKENQ